MNPVPKGFSLTSVLIPVTAMPTKTLKLLVSSGGLLLVSACTTVPTAPSVLVLPAEGKPFEQFRADDIECRQFASSQIGGDGASSAAVDSGVRTAALGTAIGAVAGAAMTGGRGTGAGAGMGLAMGSMAGAGAANASTYSMQRRYDIAYEQCMYAKGDRVPALERYAPRRAPAYVPPPPGMPPPPPPGVPPASPPGAVAQPQ